MHSRVAVFIDGENFPHRWAADLGAICAQLGSTMLKRVYGDLVKIPGWLAVPGLRPIHSGMGCKNSADMLIVLDAIEFSLTNPGVIYVLASSDSNFTHLALRLRERGHVVVGVGEDKTN